MQGSWSLTVIRGRVTVGVIYHGGGPRVDGLESTSQLAPKEVLRTPKGGSEIASGNIGNEAMVVVSALVLGLPQMAMGVDETRANDLVPTIHDSGVFGTVFDQVRTDSRDE